MKSLRELYKIGNGPSSSHTMGPEKAATEFLKKNPNAKSFRVELYGSLAATGKGHLTDWVIEETMKPRKTEIIWKPEIIHKFHTNGMKFIALDKNNKIISDCLVFSVGGGTIISENHGKCNENLEIYKLSTMDEILRYCKKENKEIWEYVFEVEGKEIFNFLKKIWNAMEEAIKIGLSKSGYLPGTLKYPRKAKQFYKKAKTDNEKRRFMGKVFAYSLAVSEENGGGGKVVTAPTCGASGVIPGLLYAMREEYSLTEDEVLKGLAIAGIFGNVIKKNATISGAEGGCQAEVGSACAMAAAMATYLLGGTIDQIEYAAEMALEHHLGLTCDPIGGYVQVPCIERNAAGAMRAIDTANYALYTNGEHLVTFDNVVHIMKETGDDLKCEYKETSLGGLAKFNFEKK